jgi:hypothetical protein
MKTKLLGKLYTSCIIIFSFLCTNQVFSRETNFIENFNNPVQSQKNWEFQHGPSEITSEGMIQKCAQAGQSAIAVLMESKNWSDYEIEFQVQIQKDVPDKGGYAGVRVRTKDNHCILIYLSSSEKELGWWGWGFGPGQAKKVDIKKGESHRIRVTCQGPTIEAFLDGEKELTITNVPLLRGGISLCTMEAEAAFSAVKVFVQENTSKKPLMVKSSNIVHNSGFEFTTAPNIPDYWGIQAWGLAEDEWIGKMDELWQRWKRDTENPYEGKYYMRVDAIYRLCSTHIRPKVGIPHVVSLYMRSEREGLPVKIEYYSFDAKWTFVTLRSSTVSVSRNWKRYTVVLPATEQSYAMIAFHPQQGVLWVDAVQVEEGKTPTVYHPLEIASTDSKTKEKNPALPKAQAYRIHEHVTLDGKLDEPFWQKAIPLELRTINGQKTQQDTKAYLVYDNKHVYIGFKCSESQMSKVCETVKTKNGPVYKDDCVEIFLDPADTREKSYYHFAVNVAGTQYGLFKADPYWAGQWDAKTSKHVDRWEVEIALPFDMFNLTSAERGNWAINLGRENPRTNEISAWSPTYGSFHNPETFGILEAFPTEISSQWSEKKNGTEPESTRLVDTIPLLINGEPFVPFGLTWQSWLLPGENTFKLMHQHGLNSLLFYMNFAQHDVKEIRTVLDLAQKYQIKVFSWRGSPGECDDKSLEEIKTIIEALKDHPAIFGWMVVDEPTNEHPEKVEAAYKLAKKLDPTRPVWVNQTPTGLKNRYLGLLGDLIVADPYAINCDGAVPSIKDIAPFVLQAKKEADGKRPVWMVLQGMSNNLEIWRGPTPDQQTAQTYLSVICGAKGIYYFNAVILPADSWKRTCELAQEVKVLTPMLCKGKLKNISCSSSKILFMCKEYDGHYYLLAVNSYHTALQEVIFDLKTLGNKFTVQNIFEQDTVTNDGTVLKVTFKPYQRICLKIKSVQ